MKKVYVKDSKVIELGRRRENKATQVISDLYPSSGYAVNIYVLRPGERVSYPAANVVLDPDSRTVIWTVSDTDTDKAGHGEVQYRYQDLQGTVVKTKIYQTFVAPTIDIPSGPAPDPYENWIETLTEQAASTDINARSAAQSASEAAGSEGEAAESAAESAASAVSAAASATAAHTAEANAEGWAELAQQVAMDNGYAQMYIDDDGTLYLTRTTNIVDKLDFNLTSDGELEVLIYG